MKLFNFKSINDGEKELQGIETWIVEWLGYSKETWSSLPNCKKNFQAFATKKEAKIFMEDLEKAGKLTNTDHDISISKQKTGI